MATTSSGPSASTATRQYLPDTNVLVTTYRLRDGEEVEAVDFMPPHFAGPTRPTDNLVVRIVRGRVGRVEMMVEFAPRFDYARSPCAWSQAEGVGVRASTPACSLTLYTSIPVTLDVGDDVARGRFVVHAGATVPFVLSFRQPATIMFRSHLPAGALAMLDETVAFWTRWIARCTYAGHARTWSAVRRSC